MKVCYLENILTLRISTVTASSRTGMGVSMTGSSYMQDDDIGGETTALAGTTL